MIKKLLAFFVSTVLVLSFAAVTMAKVNTSCDFRYLFVQTSNEEGAAHTYDNADFRVDFSGWISKTVAAKLELRVQDLLEPSATNSKFYANSYYVVIKEPFANLIIGAFDYVVQPSCNLVPACGSFRNIFVERNPTMFTGKVPLKGGAYAGFAYVSDASTAELLSDDAYDVSLGYKGEKYDIQVHYYDAKVTPAYNVINTAWNFDAYYDLSKTFRIFLFGLDPDYKCAYQQYKKEAVAGFRWTDVLGTKLFASVEYMVTGRTETSYANGAYTTQKWERAPYGINLEYKLKNGINVELEHTNINSTNDVQNLLRFKVKF